MTSPLSVTGLWVALDDANISNGCLWAVPGSHRSPPPHFFRASGDRSGSGWDAGYDPQALAPLVAQGVPLEVPAGTLVVLHGNLVHYSAANTSDRSREAFTMHVVEGMYPWREDNWLQRDDGFTKMKT
jgi:phytanoyl-CoA hydroxylase